MPTRARGIKCGRSNRAGCFEYQGCAESSLRRNDQPPAMTERTLLQVADLSMDLIRRRVTRGGRTLDLQPREFALLEVLMRADGRVLTRTMLLDRVWGINFDPGTSVVESHISRLRAKIDKPFRTSLLHTIRNTGYALHAPR